jgi:hypothetical protein
MNNKEKIIAILSILSVSFGIFYILSKFDDYRKKEYIALINRINGIHRRLTSKLENESEDD